MIFDMRLPAKTEDMEMLRHDVGMAVYDSARGVNACEIRRKAALLPEVWDSLGMVEQYIFEASVKTPVSEMPANEYADKARSLLGFVARDVGYIIPQNRDEWGYVQVRLLDIIMRYFADMTLSDIKLAFELAVVGELDDYLPKDAKGNAERKHFQNLNAEYISKILNAYKSRRKDVIAKACRAVPKPETKISREEMMHYKKNRARINRGVFYRYKYTGRLVIDFIDEMFAYNWLYNVGIAGSVDNKDDDQRQEIAMFLGYEARKMSGSRAGMSSYRIARRREIIKCFDYMIEEGIDVNNYL